MKTIHTTISASWVIFEYLCSYFSVSKNVVVDIGNAPVFAKLYTLSMLKIRGDKSFHNVQWEEKPPKYADENSVTCSTV